MADYNKAKIYKLINDSMPGKIYYGSTIKLLCQRLSTHKYESTRKNTSSKSLFESGQVKIELVENFPCENKEQLLKREGYFIRNNPCINKRIPGRTQNEWQTQIVTCECGAKITKGKLSRHKKRKIHLDLIVTKSNTVYQLNSPTPG